MNSKTKAACRKIHVRGPNEANTIVRLVKTNPRAILGAVVHVWPRRDPRVCMIITTVSGIILDRGGLPCLVLATGDVVGIPHIRYEDYHSDNGYELVAIDLNR